MPYASRFVRFAVRSLGLLATLAAPVPAQEDLDALITRELAALRASYEHLHRHPELSYQEKQTAAYLAGELRRLGFEVTENVGDYGVAGRTSYGVAVNPCSKRIPTCPPRKKKASLLRWGLCRCGFKAAVIGFSLPVSFNKFLSRPAG